MRNLTGLAPRAVERNVTSAKSPWQTAILAAAPSFIAVMNAGTLLAIMDVGRNGPGKAATCFTTRKHGLAENA